MTYARAIARVLAQELHTSWRIRLNTEAAGLAGLGTGPAICWPMISISSRAM